MTLDLESIAPEARARYVAIGRNYGSQSTLDQANQTLNGLATHGARLVNAGFALKDGAALRGARDALIAAGVGRAESKRTRKETSRAHVAAMRKAKALRLRGRSIALAVQEELEKRGGDEAKQAAQAIGSTLDLTSRGSRDAEAVAQQLDLLRELLGKPVVAAEAAERGGPKFLADATERAATLRAISAERARGRGTPEASELLDLLDGIVVHLARSARRAARSVAQEDGEPALAALFELGHLDDEAPAKSEPAPGAPEPVGA